MSGFTVARAYSATPESADELAVLVAEASGGPVTRYGLTALAGPNHAIQLLADIQTWSAVAAIYLSGKVLEGFISQFGAEAASKLISRFRSNPELQKSPVVGMDPMLFSQYVGKVALGNRAEQTLTMAFPMETIGTRNVGLDLSKVLNGDQIHDSLVLLRGAVALVELAKRLRRNNLIPVSPQNQDCSVSVILNEDGTFGGTYELFSQPRPGIPPEEIQLAGYFGPGRYRLKLMFNAAGECLEDSLERVSDY